MQEISFIDPSNIVYSDEAGIDDNEVPPTGWAPVGERCNAEKKAERKNRYNIIAALNCNKLFASFCFEGYSNKEIYEVYVERILIPVLVPGQVLIIDNASFHKSAKIIALVESVGCRVIFLPPYSPDLNPIEHWWSALKQRIRRASETTAHFFDAVVNVLSEMCMY